MLRAVTRVQRARMSSPIQSLAISVLPLVSHSQFRFSMSMLTCAFLIDDDRVQTLVHFGYPIDYVKYTILENESNYCCTAYYLLGTDQNY